MDALRGRGPGAPGHRLSPGSRGRWAVTERSAAPPALAEVAVPVAPVPTIEVVRVTGAALVLGSTTPEPPGPGPVPVVRRRSGGGAVLVTGLVWVDVLVPRGDARWHDDVGRSAVWVGQAWAEALVGLGLDARAHDGPPTRDEWSRRFCFAGLGVGEVTVEGRKVMGVAQRRTRHGARLQCAGLVDWDPAATVAAYGLRGTEAARATGALDRAAAAIGRGAGEVEAAVVAALTRR